MKNKPKKNAKQKSFFFEDYNESDIIDTKKNNIIKISSNRTIFLFFVFVSLIIIFSFKIVYLSLYPEKNFFNKKDNIFLQERRDITDRNGIILARNITIYSAGIRPTLVQNKKKLLINLRLIFPEIDGNKIKNDLNKKNFFYKKKKKTNN